MSNLNNIEALLKQHKLKRTPTRIEILKLYANNDHALTHKDIEQELKAQFDRVTIYRTLNTFEEKGIIHKIFDGSSAVKYALCGDECHNDEEHEHNHNHVHFTCNSCEKTFCIEEVETPKINLPKKFKAEDIFLVAKGICEDCTELKP